MEIINAIGRVRFASARPQRVHLADGDGYVVELICMEAGQRLKVASGGWTYYVVMGTAALTANHQTAQVPTGQLAVTAAAQPHTLANAGPGRLVCLAIGRPS